LFMIFSSFLNLKISPNFPNFNINFKILNLIQFFSGFFGRGGGGLALYF
jgi:hypothetical protein